MSIKFDESLSALVDTLESEGINSEENITVVRDGMGRLIVAFAAELGEPARIERALRSRLGAYAAPLAVVQGGPALRLASDPSLKVLGVSTASGLKRIKYGDRRIVGADWLTAPISRSDFPPRLVFGSLKGGVGRSTALTVLAADLARAGKRVLAIDLDLEAPGIGFMLLPAAEDASNDKRPKYGVIDYLVENGMNGFHDDELTDCIGVADFADGFVHVVPAAGRTTDDCPQTMLAKLSRALVEDVTSQGARPIGVQMNEMISRFSKFAQYDAILIDARAGMAEISAAPLVSLGAEVLLFGTNQPQTFRGYRYLISHVASVASEAHAEAWQNWREQITFVQSKAPASSQKRASFRSEIYNLCAEFIYDKEALDAEGRVASGSFNPAPEEVGPGVPHDSTYVENHPDYEAFDPTSDGTQLDPDVIRGPFGDFLTRAWNLLGLERGASHGRS